MLKLFTKLPPLNTAMLIKLSDSLLKNSKKLNPTTTMLTSDLSPSSKSRTPSFLSPKRSLKPPREWMPSTNSSSSLSSKLWCKLRTTPVNPPSKLPSRPSKTYKLTSKRPSLILPTNTLASPKTSNPPLMVSTKLSISYKTKSSLDTKLKSALYKLKSNKLKMLSLLPNKTYKMLKTLLMLKTLNGKTS